jgi:hypothetical protein
MPATNPWLAANAGLILIVMALLIVALSGAFIWLAVRLRKVEAQYRTLTMGAEGASLEAVLESHIGQVHWAVDRTAELDALTHRLEREGHAHIQRVGFLRFNPFRDAGGDQSFALALTDQDGNGVVISSLHSRDVTRVYGKPLVAWQSSYSLTEEERAAIGQAQNDVRILN